MRLRNALAILTIGCVSSLAAAQDQPIPAPGDKPSELPGAPRPGGRIPERFLRPELAPNARGAERVDGDLHIEIPAHDVYFVREALHEKGAYLGVATSPPAQALRQQLKLAPGTGLGVDFVEKDSPAGT